MKKGLLTPAFLLVAVTLLYAQVAPGLKAAKERGKKVYDTYCLSCHMEDGNGVPRLNPPLVKTSYVSGNKSRLISILLKGFEEQVEINGEYFTNVMAPHDFLKDQEIADVLTYVRNSFGNKGSMVSKREVEKVRSTIKK